MKIYNVAMSKNNIIKIRKKLDKLDNLFLIIFTNRTLLVNQVLKILVDSKDIIEREINRYLDIYDQMN